MKVYVFTIVSILILAVPLAAPAAPVEPCPYAKSCTQAKQICERGNFSGCYGFFENCRKTGIFRGNTMACSVPSRN